MVTEQSTAKEFIDGAARFVESEFDPPMSLEEFLEKVLNNPELVCSASEYLLRAIEHFGTRIVTESGEELERWRFFDDPANDGEHAVLGNTDLLNRFVEELRGMARGSAGEEKMFWFEGPTATGKSELKRCLTNGLNAFSKTEDGRRFTVQWNLSPSTDSSLPNEDGPSSDDRQPWHESPVQMNPLSLFPKEIRREILYGEDAEANDWIPPDIDPFSAEIYDRLMKHYGGDFRKIIGNDHLRVVQYHLEVGRGIGVLQSEDIGDPRNKLVGEWMPGMVKELDSRGYRNPQALSYDGVLSQGNAGLTVIEDAAHHFDTILKMLSVPEDDEVKIDRRTILPIDTVPVIISNPDMRGELMKTTERAEDSHRAIRRRLDLYEIPYLVTPSLEAELLHRLLQGYETVWGDDDGRTIEAMYLGETEVAPHGLEAAAYYNVVSRLEKPTDLDINRVSLARLFDGESVGAKEFTADDFDGDYRREDSQEGIPCTFTRDVIADAAASSEGVVMPGELIDAMHDRIRESPVFSADKWSEYERVADEIAEYILEQQENDVLDAILRDHTVSKEEVEEYIENVFCWGTDEDTVEPDPLKMQVFEKKHLGLFSDSHYGLDTPMDVSGSVEDFRREKVISSVSTYLYDHHGGDYEVDLEEVPVSAVPELKELLEENDWDDVYRIFDNLVPRRWSSPIEGTQTEAVKQETIENMIKMFGYSRESAAKTSNVVMKALVQSNVWPAKREDNEEEVALRGLNNGGTA